VALIVQKFGGTSVADLDRIRHVAGRVQRTHAEGHQVAVVVSAMAGETNRLLALAKAAHPRPAERESDVLASTGEQVTSALTALVLHDLGVPARSFLGHQVRIETDSAYGRARIVRIDAERLRETLASGTVAVVAGFQGVDADGSITTLGRGGSDTSAVALAAALGAEACEIYTDVAGVFTADPRLVPGALKLDAISYEEMLEMAASGAKVMMARSIEIARRYGVPLRVRSTFVDGDGTWIGEEDALVLEKAIVSGVTHDTSEAKVSIVGVPDRPGVAAQVFRELARAGVNIDMIVQNASQDGEAAISFTLPKTDVPTARPILDRVCGEIGARRWEPDEAIAKISLIGAGMKSHPGVAADMFDALAEAGINIEIISTSSIRVSCVIRAEEVERAVQAVHDRFQPLFEERVGVR